MMAEVIGHDVVTGYMMVGCGDGGRSWFPVMVLSSLGGRTYLVSKGHRRPIIMVIIGWLRERRESLSVLEFVDPIGSFEVRILLIDWLWFDHIPFRLASFGTVTMPTRIRLVLEGLGRVWIERIYTRLLSSRATFTANVVGRLRFVKFGLSIGIHRDLFIRKEGDDNSQVIRVLMGLYQPPKKVAGQGERASVNRWAQYMLDVGGSVMVGVGEGEFLPRGRGGLRGGGWKLVERRGCVVKVWVRIRGFRGSGVTSGEGNGENLGWVRFYRRCVFVAIGLETLLFALCCHNVANFSWSNAKTTDNTRLLREEGGRLTHYCHKSAVLICAERRSASFCARPNAFLVVKSKSCEFLVTEVEIKSDMLNEIGQLNIDVNEDTCTWSLGPNGTFTVKDARYRIDQNILPTLAHATTWDKSIPRKVNVFMWRLSLDRLPHRLNLSSRGMDIPAISCPSCNANVESANHIFFECDIATDMWKLVFRWCDIPLFQASSWDSFNDWIISWHASKEKKHRFYVITTSVLWWLWRYRNSVTFNSQPLRKSDLFDNVRFSSFSWLHNRDHMKLSWNDWLMYPLSIARNGNG
ncbi:RNA-directed DNA polymerase, eukaryota [Tanacetum coccineum]